jgi:hypothetical protein
VSDLITIDAVTTSALGFWTDEVTGAPRCASPLPKVMGTDLRQGIVAVPAAAVQGDPPRRTPPRC